MFQQHSTPEPPTLAHRMCAAFSMTMLVDDLAAYFLAKTQRHVSHADPIVADYIAVYRTALDTPDGITRCAFCGADDVTLNHKGACTECAR